MKTTTLSIIILYFIVSLNPFMQAHASDSPLRSGKWVKISTNKAGVYKITYEQLKEWGFSSPVNIQIFGTGGGKLPLIIPEGYQTGIKEIASFQNLGSDDKWNTGDYLLFFAEGPDVFEKNTSKNFYDLNHNPFCRSSYYFVTDGAEKPVQITTSETVATEIQHHVEELDFFAAKEYSDTNLYQTGSRRFNIFPEGSLSHTFTIPNIANGSKIKIHTYLLGRSAQNGTITVKANGSKLTTGNVSPYSTYIHATAFDIDTETTATTSLKIDFSFSNKSYDSYGACDYIYINARIKPVLTSGQSLIFDQKATGKVSQYQLSSNKDYTIWDIASKTHPVIQPKTYKDRKISFTTNGSGSQEFWAFDLTSAYAPIFIGNVPNQNLMGKTDIDMVIVSSDALKPFAQEIADLHKEKDSLSVLIVNQQQIFNEFSTGKADNSAIRDFMRRLYINSNKRLKYLLLFGDGSYNNKNANEESNLIMTFQSSNSHDGNTSLTSDDYFCFLEDTEGMTTADSFSGDMDISVGRMPVNNDTEAETAVKKLKKYYEAKETAGNWCNNLCFVADDADANNGTPETYHTTDAESFAVTAASIAPQYNHEKIYLDAFKGELSAGGERYPEAEEKLVARIKNGVLVVSFSGHGSPARLTQELLLTTENIKDWKNIDKLPIFITASCDISVFDNPGLHTLGEALFRQDDGGCIALFTTTRPVISSANKALGNHIFRHILTPRQTLGESIRIAKNKYPGINTRKFVLLGDPALKLHLPEQKVVIDSINHIPIKNFTDTIKALSKIEISGHIEKFDKTFNRGFNGKVYLSLYDKERALQTLGNSGNDPIPYKDQTNIVFNGKSTVTGGKFDIQFIVPKDIMPYYGNAKLSFFANDGSIMAAGYDTTIVLGGANKIENEDFTGPEISLYLNNTAFKSGGNTDESPVLLARLIDSTGINLSSGSIGHTSTAVLDYDESEAMELNNYFEADLNSYQKGWIRYPLRDLEDGYHHLNVKVWDAVNNSSEESIEFYVTQSAELIIEKLINYPNPFSEYTNFYFEHNQQNETLFAKISVYSTSGKLSAVLRYQIHSNGFTSGPIEWAGTDNSGNKLAPGMYFYKLEIAKIDTDTKNSNSFTKAFEQKSLVIIR